MLLPLQVLRDIAEGPPRRSTAQTRQSPVHLTRACHGGSYFTCVEWKCFGVVALAVELSGIAITPTVAVATSKSVHGIAKRSGATPKFFDCGVDEVVRPTSITLACADANEGIDNVAWRTWGQVEARGSGTYFANTCEPSCAASNTFARFTVDVRLFDVGLCHRTRHYRYVSYRFRTRRPDYVDTDLVTSPVDC